MWLNTSWDTIPRLRGAGESIVACPRCLCSVEKEGQARVVDQYESGPALRSCDHHNTLNFKGQAGG